MPGGHVSANGNADNRTVHAVRDGKASAGWQKPSDHDYGAGYRVVVDTGDGHADIYGHLDPTAGTAAGDVKAGDPIGRVADPTNGHSSAPHVHFGRQRLSDKAFVDPGPVSPLNGGIPTSGWQSLDAWHPDMHSGRDWAPAP